MIVNDVFFDKRRIGVEACWKYNAEVGEKMMWLYFK